LHILLANFSTSFGQVAEKNSMCLSFLTGFYSHGAEELRPDVRN